MLLQTCPLSNVCLSPAGAGQRGRGLSPAPPAPGCGCPGEPRGLGEPGAAPAGDGQLDAPGDAGAAGAEQPVLGTVRGKNPFGCWPRGSLEHLPSRPPKTCKHRYRRRTGLGELFPSLRKGRRFPLSAQRGARPGEDIAPRARSRALPAAGPRGSGLAPVPRGDPGYPGASPPRPEDERHAQATRLPVAASLPRCDHFRSAAAQFYICMYLLAYCLK